MKTVLLILFLVPLTTFAQRTEAEVFQLLNQGGEKTWLYEGTETIMNGSGSCTEGKYYLFREDKKVVVGECINNQWVLQEKSYSIRAETAVDWFITIGNQEYELIITEIPAYDEIKLRLHNGVDKPDPAFDIVLQYLKDD